MQRTQRHGPTALKLGPADGQHKLQAGPVVVGGWGGVGGGDEFWRMDA